MVAQKTWYHMERTWEEALAPSPPKKTTRISFRIFGYSLFKLLFFIFYPCFPPVQKKKFLHECWWGVYIYLCIMELNKITFADFFIIWNENKIEVLLMCALFPNFNFVKFRLLWALVTLYLQFVAIGC